LLAALLKKDFLRKFGQMYAKHANRSALNEVSKIVIGCTSAVLNTLGAGFLEKSMRPRWHYNSARRTSPSRSNMAAPSRTTVLWSAHISWTCWSRMRFWSN